jgi:hypothetical protein
MGAPAQVAQSATTVFVYGSAAVAATSMLLSSSSAVALFALANQLQIILSLIVLNVYLPDSLIFYLTSFEFSLGDFNVLQDFGPSWTPSWVQSIVTPEANFPAITTWKASLGKIKQHMIGLETIGYEYQSFLFNYFSVVRTLIIGVTFNLVCIGILLLLRKCKNKFAGIFKSKINGFFHFGFYI